MARPGRLPLRIVGGIYDADYFARRQRILAPGEFVGAMPRARLRHVMARAAVTLMPIRWEETFGLVAAEAQMCRLSGRGLPARGFV